MFSPNDISDYSSKGKVANSKQELPIDESEPMDTDTIKTNLETGDTDEDPSWLKTLQNTIEHRISKTQNEAAQIEKSNQICQELVTRGRNTLHKAIRCGLDSKNNLYTEGVQDPQVVRLRYGMQPRSSMDSSGVSVVMDLEVDVYLPEIQNSSQNAKSTNPSSQSISIHDFSVSCLLPKPDQSSSQNNSPVTCEQIRTVSGLVPMLQPGECVTILASVYFINLDIGFADKIAECSKVNISIQGHWVDRVSQARANSTDLPKRHGTILCSFQLPKEIFYLSASSSSSCGGRCVEHEIDFVASAINHKKYETSAIFEYREPHTLAVDLSSGGSTLQSPQTWKELVSSLNDRIGMNSHIDIFWEKGDPRMKLVVFGSNLEERAGKCGYLSF
jgi:hypothetical protein